MRKRHTRTYYRFLLSYIALLLTGIFALVIFSQSFFIVQLRESLDRTQQGAVRRLAQRLDSDIQQIFSIDYQISSVNENFLSYYLSEDSPVRDLRIVRELRNMLAPSDFIAEIAIYTPEDDQVYTSTASYAKRLFFSDIYRFESWADPIGDLDTLTSRMVRPAESVNHTQRYITFINAPSVFSRLGHAVQLYFINENLFLEQLSPSDTPSQQGAVYDGNGRLLVTTLELPDSSPLVHDRYTAAGVQYEVYREPSQIMDWTYVFFIPRSEHDAPIMRAQLIIILILTITFALGLTFIWFFMKVTYTPLRELTMSLGASQEGDDLESLRDTLHSLSTQNASMRNQLMLSPDGQMLKDALLFSLLKQKYASFDAFNRDAAALDMTFDKPYYQVLMLRHFGQGESLSRDVLNAALHEALDQRFTFLFRELFEQSMIVCLVGMDTFDDQTALAECLLHLMDMLEARHGVSLTIGASECYQAIEHMATACFEATQAVQEYFIRGKRQFIRYSEINHKMTLTGDYLAELQGIAEESPAQQQQAVKRFIARLRDDHVPSLLTQGYCNAAVQLLLPLSSQRTELDDLFTIGYLRTLDDYQDVMLRMFTPVAEPVISIPALESATDNELLQRIYANVAETYDNCSFSIQETADQLGMNSSYISQYFKQQTGETLTDYVTSLRIQKARTLLHSTTMPIQMIAESVGYYNVNSFIRRFKQITGETPGEYRRTRQ